MKYHYTYLITYLDGKLYHGVRSCRCEIADDPYMGSSVFTPKSGGAKTIMTTHETREDAYLEEIRYHKEHSVDTNEEYYNKARSTVLGFSCVRSGKDHPFYGKRHTEDNLDNLRETLSDNRSKGYLPKDRDIYTFTHKKTLEAFTGTRVEFREKFPEINFRNIDDAVRFLNWKTIIDGSEFKGKKRHSVKGWVISK